MLPASTNRLFNGHGQMLSRELERLVREASRGPVVSYRGPLSQSPTGTLYGPPRVVCVAPPK